MKTPSGTPRKRHWIVVPAFFSPPRKLGKTIPSAQSASERTDLRAARALAALDRMPMLSSEPPVTAFLLHISSSGGTSLCKLAQEQPCSRVPSCGANCNLNCRHPWDWRDHCRAPACTPPARACRPPHKPGCAGLRRYVARKNLTFLSSETMLLEGPCPDFAYVTVLRDPVARLRSQLERMSEQPNRRLQELLSRPHVYNHRANSSLMGTAAIDNYVIRMLLGTVKTRQTGSGRAGCL